MIRSLILPTMSTGSILKARQAKRRAFRSHNSKSAAKNAKNPPTAYTDIATPRITVPTRRICMQVFACAGSTGHGALRESHFDAAAAKSNPPAIRNNGPLWAVSQISPGTFAASPAMTAPAPIVTRSAGSAQHRSVETLANSANAGAAVSRTIRRIRSNFHNVPTATD